AGGEEHRSPGERDALRELARGVVGQQATPARHASSGATLRYPTHSATPLRPLAAGLFSPALMEGADHATRAHPACGLLAAAGLRRQACSRVRRTFQRMRTVRVRAAGGRRNGRTRVGTAASAP